MSRRQGTKSFDATFPQETGLAVAAGATATGSEVWDLGTGHAMGAVVVDFTDTNIFDSPQIAGGLNIQVQASNEASMADGARLVVIGCSVITPLPVEVAHRPVPGSTADGGESLAGVTIEFDNDLFGATFRYMRVFLQSQGSATATANFTVTT